MQTEDSQKVVKRFFEAIYFLKASKNIRGLQTFTNRYNINKRNLYQLKDDHSRDIFQAAWLTYLVNDYGVSATWLLTGNGSIFPEKKQNK